MELVETEDTERTDSGIEGEKRAGSGAKIRTTDTTNKYL